MNTSVSGNAKSMLSPILAIAAFAILTTQTGFAAGNAVPEKIDPQVEKALLAEDWGKVAQLLDTVKPETPSPVLRLIKGHACLALNRNNESLCLFLSASNRNDIRSFLNWSNELVKKNSNNSTAHYINGDALARDAKWDIALKEFSAALKYLPKNYLALNARGVTHAFKEAWDSALVDLDEATRVAPGFTDAFASNGALRIHMRKMPKGALENFTKALKISPDYVLALNGRGAVEQILSEWENSDSDLKKAADLSISCLAPVAAIVNLNGASMLYAKSQAAARKAVQLAGIEPGTFIGGQTMTPESYDAMKNQIKKDLSNKPIDVVSKIGGYASSSLDWNTKAGQMNPLNWTKKTDVALETSSKINGGIVGDVPFASGGASSSMKANASFDFGGDYSKDRLIQKATTEAIQEMYPILGKGMAPNASELLNPFSRTRTDGFDFTHGSGKYGGVCPEGLGQAKVESGDWKVATMYGLFYRKTE